VPADTAALQMTIGTFGSPGPRVGVSIRNGSSLITSGALAPGWREGVVSLPVAPRVRASRDRSTVCIHDFGPARLALAGVAPYGGTGLTMRVAGHTVFGELRIDYLRSGRESWFSLLPTLAHRMTIGKGSYVRGWAWIGAPLLVLAVAALAIRALLATDRRW
jgi:hypothetical protein